MLQVNTKSKYMESGEFCRRFESRNGLHLQRDTDEFKTLQKIEFYHGLVPQNLPASNNDP